MKTEEKVGLGLLGALGAYGLSQRLLKPQGALAQILGVATVVQGSKVLWTVVWKNTGINSNVFKVWVQTSVAGTYVLGTIVTVTVAAGAQQTTSQTVDLAAMGVALGTYDVTYAVADSVSGVTLAWTTHAAELVVVAAAPTATIVSAGIVPA